MNIVHPAYTTSEPWFDSIDATKVSVPAWRPLSELHPCDLQSSMLKGCTPADDGVDAFYSISRRRRIRRICACCLMATKLRRESLPTRAPLCLPPVSPRFCLPALSGLTGTRASDGPLR